MKKIIASVLILGLILVNSAGAANTVNTRGGKSVIQVSAMDSDFNLVAQTGFTNHEPAGAPIIAIFFYPGAANDVLVVEQQNDAGPVIAKMKSLDGEPRVMYFQGAKLKPYIDYSDCTLSSGAFVVFFIDTK